MKKIDKETSANVLLFDELGFNLTWFSNAQLNSASVVTIHYQGNFGDSTN